ncbi:MAG: hypothetical protein VXX85_04735 [Candidatus Margulisiibacteriota bacterium]|nr:hypothetical protein [Candidatus Margulisiibacteriota bacterium]
MGKHLITTIVNYTLKLIPHLNKHYRFFRRWRPTITFSVGRLLWGWIPPQFFSLIT